MHFYRVVNYLADCCFTAAFATVFFPESLEQDVKRLKTDLQANRQLESELRSQLSSLSSQDRSLRSELGQLRQDNELLQNKWVHTQHTDADITALHNQWHLLTRAVKRFAAVVTEQEMGFGKLRHHHFTELEHVQ